MTYKTGFCSNGHCEGTSPTSPTGKPMKVCVAHEVCECSCHAKFTKMYKMAGEPRRVHENPHYKPAPNPDLSFIVRGMQDAGDGSLSAPTFQRTTFDERPSETAAGLPESARAWTPAPDGRRQRGQLEAQVQALANRAMLGEFDKQLTPQYVAELLDPDNPPSVGAIGAVFDRWEKIGYAAIHRKPVYFRHLTPQGMMLGLEEMKRKAARK